MNVRIIIKETLNIMTEIKYNRFVNYVGGNRYGIQTGIVINSVTGINDIIRLRPTNTRDTTPPCSMQIPHENLQEFIDELQKLV